MKIVFICRWIVIPTDKKWNKSDYNGKQRVTRIIPLIIIIIGGWYWMERALNYKIAYILPIHLPTCTCAPITQSANDIYIFDIFERNGKYVIPQILLARFHFPYHSNKKASECSKQCSLRNVQSTFRNLKKFFFNLNFIFTLLKFIKRCSYHI